MDNRSDIWHFLRDHETPPPPELLHHIYDALPTLNKLQQVEITPPAFIRQSIIERINPAIPARPWKKALYTGVAASILLLIGASLYKTFVPAKLNKQNETTAKSSTGPVTQPPIAIPITEDSNKTAIAPSPNEPSIDSNKIAIKAGYAGKAAINIDGHSIRLVDNDPLFTFTSFQYPEMSNYFEAKKEEEIKIRVDRYTNIVLSKQAASMIRDMYTTKSNGKPTRKARRAKEKLEGWKRTDEKYFDGIRPLNPTDPFDLGEFIFK